MKRLHTPLLKCLLDWLYKSVSKKTLFRLVNLTRNALCFITNRRYDNIRLRSMTLREYLTTERKACLDNVFFIALRHGEPYTTQRIEISNKNKAWCMKRTEWLELPGGIEIRSRTFIKSHKK